MKILTCMLCLCLFIVSGCTKSGSGSTGGPVDPCGNITKSFSANVNPIIQSVCATNSGCHGSGSMNGPGPLLTYNQIFSARVSIRLAVSSGTMPLTGSLSQAERNSIVCWIDSGAPNN